MFLRRSITAVAAVLSAAALVGTAAPAAVADTQADTVADAAADSARTAGSYRYWSFWEQKDGKDGDGGQGPKDTAKQQGSAPWAFATKGPSQLRPEDGAVLGFRFALSKNSQDAATPRGRTEFEAVCSGTNASDGQKRIAFRIDFGTAKDAPEGETPPEPRTACAQVGEDATAADALAEVAKPLRYDSSSLLCAVQGYPKSGCGEQASDDSGGKKDAAEDAEAAGKDVAGKDEPEGGDGAGLGTTVGLAAGAAAIAVLAFAAVRRARSRD
jgi:hypothetical protein